MACKAIKFSKIKQNKGYCAVEDHSRSPMSVPIESLYGFLLEINTNTNWHSVLYRFEVIANYFKILDENWSLCVFEPPVGA